MYDNVIHIYKLGASVNDDITIMKIKTTLIIMGILTSLFGCGQNKKTETQEEVVKESFSIIEATNAENKPILGSFNTAYKDFNNKSKYPWCLKIAIGLELNNLFENGLPKDEEKKIADKFEDELLTEIQKISKSQYLGHLYNDTFLDVYVYLENPEKVHEFLQTQVNKEGITRGFGYEINQDPTWEIVKPFLK